MTLPLILIAPLLAALQAAPPADRAAPTTLEDLSLEQAASLRCAVAFAYVSSWQDDDDPRGADFPAMEEQGGREFFVRALAQLMDDRGLDRRGVFDLVALQTEAFKQDEAQIGQIMPACLMMKRSAGL